jgi:hypothetical protein
MFFSTATATAHAAQNLALPCVAFRCISGSMLGMATSGMGTYTSVIEPDDNIYGDGHGLITTADGELVTCLGTTFARSARSCSVINA